MYVLLMLMKPEILIEASGCIIDMPHRKCELLDISKCLLAVRGFLHNLTF